MKNFFQKKKKTRKNTKKLLKKKEEKKGKRAHRGFFGTRDGPKNCFFYIRTVNRNRNEIDAPKKSDFEHPTKKKKMKMTENDRK